MSICAEMTKYIGRDAISLKAGKYEAIVAPFLGSNVMKLVNTEDKIDFFRNDESLADLSDADLQATSAVYGLPTLYLPNRLHKGILKVSDYTYQLPLNEPDLNNHIHGFLHTRKYTVDSIETTDTAAIAKTSYVYDENDEFFQYFPVKFKAEFVFTLTDNGLDYEFTMTNLSDRQLPYGVCNHTAMKGPFIEGGKGENVRLYVPVSEKIKIDGNCIPTGDILPLSDYDRNYLTGDQMAVLQDINNDFYYAAEGELNGEPFYGVTATDIASGKKIVYEVSRDFKFWIIWNDKGGKGYFCPEPMSWIIDAPNQNLTAKESGYIELAPGESKTVTEKFYTL